MDQVLVKKRNLELMILKVVVDSLTVGFVRDPLQEQINVKVLPERDQTVVKLLVHEVLFLLLVCEAGVNVHFDVGLETLKVRQSVYHLLLGDFVRHFLLQLCCEDVVAHELRQLL